MSFEKVVLDIETNGLMNGQEGLDFSKRPYKLKEDYKIWCIVIRDIETYEFKTLTLDQCTKENLQDLLKNCTELVGHNIINFDLPTLKLLGILDYKIGYPGKPSFLFDKECLITDTLCWSRLLNPDRYDQHGRHSLESWGLRLGDQKTDFHDFSQFSEEMVRYCEQDTNVNVRLYHHLMYEKGEKTNWDKAYSMEAKLIDLTLKQEVFGFFFDKELAAENIKFLDAEMQRIRNIVNPLLPPKKLNKGEQKFYTWPKNVFKINGDIAATTYKWAEKIGGKIIPAFFSQEAYLEFNNEKYSLKDQKPLNVIIPSDIDDLNDLKLHLINLSWVPTEWKERDLFKKPDKTKKTPKELEETIDRYVKQTFDGVFAPHRCEILEVACTPEALKFALTEKAKGAKNLWVPTSPKIAIGLEKNICPGLEKLGEKASFVKDLIKYLTYKHRRNSILGGEIEFDPDDDFENLEPEKGFIAYVREDNRISTPANTLGANTARYRHSLVVNVPRVSSLFGDKMRALFGCGEGYYQWGFDFASLEARIQSHYCIPYTDGKKLSEMLLAQKPNDVHCFDQETQILTPFGWKNFGDIKKGELVAQWNNGVIDFVPALDVIWQPYNGEMLKLEGMHNSYYVTPNHRILWKSIQNMKKGDQKLYESLTKDFINSDDKLIPIAGITSNPKLENISDDFLKLVVATQADGYLCKDSSAIQFSFTKERKVERLKIILNALNCKYSYRTYERKNKLEHVFRLNADEITIKIRSFLTYKKEFTNKFYNLSAEQIECLINEIQYWDGTITKNGDIVIDTTDFVSAEIIQTLACLINKKARFSTFNKKGTYKENCKIFRVYISNKARPYSSFLKNFEKFNYEGMIGCVTVSSGAVLVKRNNKIFVSGNSKLSQKIGIPRPLAKSVFYGIVFGAQPKKIMKMAGCDLNRAQKIYDDFWNAVPALKELKEKLEEHWIKNDKKFIVGLDGRKLVTRSKHALLNVLFQSGGAIFVKWSLIRACEEMENRGILGDPFIDDQTAVKIFQMVVNHDEVQYACHPRLLTTKVFATEEEAKQNLEPDCSAIGHSEKGYYIAYKSLPVWCVIQAIHQVEKELKLRIEMGIEHSAGKTWFDTH